MRTRFRSMVALALSAGMMSAGCSLMPAPESKPSLGPFMREDDPPMDEPAHNNLDQNGFLDNVKGP